MDIPSYYESLDARLTETEPVVAFAERLRSNGAEAPDRFDLSDGLSPAEGEVLALFYNPELRLARLEAGVALAEFETAGLWQDPVFGFDGADILSASSPFEYGLTLSFTIPISGRLGVEKDRASAAYEAELRRVVDAEWATRAMVRRMWAEWTASEERVGLLREAIAQVERISSITDQLEATGELSRVEGRLFRVELADERAELYEAELRVVRAEVELLGLLGLPPGAAVELEPAFPLVDPPEVADETARLIESNTELATRRALYQVAEESLRLEVRKQYPDITIGSGYGSETGDDRLLLGVAMPIPVLNANKASIARARARREVARVAAETTFERLLRDLVAAKAALEAAQAGRAQFELHVVPMVTEQSEELERIVALGEVDTFLLLETVTRQLDTKSRLLDLRVAEIEASVDITRLLGPETPSAPAPIRAQEDTDNPSEGADSAPVEEDIQ